MSRSFRWNHQVAEQLAPDMCEACHELSVEHVVHTYPVWGGEFEHSVCSECLEDLVSLLRKREIEYRVGGGRHSF